MKKIIPFVLVAGILGLAASTVTMSVDRSSLMARVAFLEKYIKTPETVSEDEAARMLRRLSPTQTAMGPNVTALLARVAEIAETIPGGLVSAETAASRIGSVANVFGVVSQTYQGTDKNGAPFMTATLKGGFQVTWFRADTSHALWKLKAGDGLVVTGRIGEYQGSPQIIIGSPQDVTLP